MAQDKEIGSPFASHNSLWNCAKCLDYRAALILSNSAAASSACSFELSLKRFNISSLECPITAMMAKSGTLTIMQGEDGIYDVVRDSAAGPMAVYSLSGRFVRMVNADEIDNMRHLLQPSVYIINGKKVLVK